MLVSLAHWLTRAELLYPTLLDQSSECKKAAPDTWAPRAEALRTALRFEMVEAGGVQRRCVGAAPYQERERHTGARRQDLVLLLAQSVQLLSCVQVFCKPHML